MKDQKIILHSSQDMENLIDELCPDSKEKETAKIRLEECVYWANKAIVKGGHGG